MGLTTKGLGGGEDVWISVPVTGSEKRTKTILKNSDTIFDASSCSGYRAGILSRQTSFFRVKCHKGLSGKFRSKNCMFFSLANPLRYGKKKSFLNFSLQKIERKPVGAGILKPTTMGLFRVVYPRCSIGRFFWLQRVFRLGKRGREQCLPYTHPKDPSLLCLSLFLFPLLLE